MIVEEELFFFYFNVFLHYKYGFIFKKWKITVLDGNNVFSSFFVLFL